jgi:hypothetical protein
MPSEPCLEYPPEEILKTATRQTTPAIAHRTGPPVAKQISREALQSRYQRNRRAAAHAYVAIAKKQKQPVPQQVLQIISDTEPETGTQPSRAKRPA